jgi:methionyl-tRNA synthetase
VRAPDRLTLCIAPPPTPNGPLHLGHASGPYIAADALVRFTRDQGADALLVCGIDSHQNYVDAAALAAEEDVRTFLERNAELVKADFVALDIQPDIFSEPHSSPDYARTVAALFDELVERGLVTADTGVRIDCARCAREMSYAWMSGACSVCGAPSAAGTCETCAGYSLPEALLDARCTVCGDTALRYSEAVRWSYAPADGWQALVLDQLARPASASAACHRVMSELSRTAPHRVPVSWAQGRGISVLSPDGGPPQVLDVWFEMGLFYLSLLRDTELAGSGPVKVIHTFGIDNSFFYGLLFPSLYAIAERDLELEWRMNYFLELDGSKFSTSRRHAVWVSEIASGDAGSVRERLMRFHPMRPGVSVSRVDVLASDEPTLQPVNAAAQVAEGAAPAFIEQAACFDLGIALALADQAQGRGAAGAIQEAVRGGALVTDVG